MAVLEKSPNIFERTETSELGDARVAILNLDDREYFDFRHDLFPALSAGGIVNRLLVEMADDFDDDIDFSAFEVAEKPQTPQTAEPSRSFATNGPSKVQQPKPQALPGRQAPSSILVSTRQKGNPILNYIRQLPWEWSEIPSDYVLGNTTCALFLSLKYHRLHPEYIYSRIRALGGKYNLRVLLTMVDIQNHEESLKELSKTSLINNLTLILCWSAQEAGRYIELFKSFEHASAASIRAHQAESYKDSLVEFVTTPRSINKSDAASLISNFGTLRAAVNAQPEEIGLVPGWGEKKVQQWCGTVRENFRVRKAARGGVHLRRGESTRDSLGESDGPDDDSRETSRTPRLEADPPIPIGMIPSRKSSNLASRHSPKTPDDHDSRQKKPTPRTFQSWEPGEDEEDAFLLAAAEESSVPVVDTGNKGTPATSSRKEDEMSDGVMAALARLREKG